MPKYIPTIERRRSEDFSAATNERDARLLDTWHWISVSMVRSGASWEDQVEWIKTAIVRIAKNLSEEDQVGCLNLSAPFLPSGLLAMAAALIDADHGARFFLPQVSYMYDAPGYIYSFMCIEYKDGFIDRLLGRSGLDFVGGQNSVSLYFVHEEDFQAAAKLSVGRADICGKKLSNQVVELLSLAKYLILVDGDFDIFLLGARNEYASRIEEVTERLSN